MSDPKIQLEDIIREGVGVDLYHVEEVLSLDEFIGHEAVQINASTFGAFFGSLQIILGRFLVLQVARIFEKPNSRYSIRSIPSAMNVLREHHETLDIQERPGIIELLCQTKASPKQLQSLSDSELTLSLVEYFDNRINSNQNNIETLKNMRDKRIAHPEIIKPEMLLEPKLAEIDQLVVLAKSFVNTVSFGYFRTIYHKHDAKRATTCLRRLLRKAAVVPDE